MSWRPPPTTDLGAVAPFAFRAAVLHDGDRPAGHLLCRPNTYWERAGGRLWWRRWHRPQTTVEAWLVLPGVTDFQEHFLHGESLEQELARWSRGTAVEDGRTLSLVWLDDLGSTTVAWEVFGLDLTAERGRRRQTI